MMNIRVLLLTVLVFVGAPLLALADLRVFNVQTNGTTIPPNGSITVTFSISNIGSSPASLFTIAGYSNRSTSCTSGLILEDSAVISLGAGQQINGSYVLHARPGDTILYGVVKADIFGQVPENNENNNCARTLKITVQRPDLTVFNTFAPIPSMIAPGGDATRFAATIRNRENTGIGTGYRADASTNRYYLSSATSNPPLIDRLPIQVFVPSLDVNEMVLIEANINVPEDFPEGTYNLFAEADGNGQVVEGNENNNFSTSPQTLEVVAFCTLVANLDGDPAFDIRDLVTIVNSMVSLVDSGNAHINLKRSPPPLPEVIDNLDLLAAFACFGTHPSATGSGGDLYDFSIQAASGGGYQVAVNLSGQVVAIDTYVKLPAGFTWIGAAPINVLTGSATSNHLLGQDERYLTNEFRSIFFSSAYLDGVVITTDLAPTPAIDLTALETVTDPSDFSSGIAVRVLFDDGTSELMLKRWSYLNIPDPALRTYLTSYYGLPANSAIPLGLAQSTSLLDLSDLNIADLTGITDLGNLQFLTCSRNQLTTLPDLGAMNQLLHLTASQNQLHTVGTLPDSLLTLNVDDNLLTALPDLPSSLIMLIVARNELSVLPDLDGLTDLEVLDFNTNGVASLPALPASLTSLFAGRNHLDDITSLGGQIFEILWLAENQLYDMGALTSLTYAPDAILFLYDTYNR